VSYPTLLLTTSSLQGTPSPGPPRLKKTPAAVYPLPQGGEGLQFLHFSRGCRLHQSPIRGSEGVLPAIKWERTLACPRAQIASFRGVLYSRNEASPR
jgi:hypothetical protein